MLVLKVNTRLKNLCFMNSFQSLCLEAEDVRPVENFPGWLWGCKDEKSAQHRSFNVSLAKDSPTTILLAEESSSTVPFVFFLRRISSSTVLVTFLLQRISLSLLGFSSTMLLSFLFQRK